MPRYDAKRIENRWQAYWDEHQTFVLQDTLPEADAPKMYVLDMFPYPSGSGLHVGHPEGYTATDITVRYARMNGKCMCCTRWAGMRLDCRPKNMRSRRGPTRGKPPKRTLRRFVVS